MLLYLHLVASFHLLKTFGFTKEELLFLLSELVCYFNRQELGH